MFGLTVLIYFLVQGGLAELVFALTRHRLANPEAVGEQSKARGLDLFIRSLLGLERSAAMKVLRNFIWVTSQVDQLVDILHGIRANALAS
ncbi:MAG: hypothetical protein WCP28_19000 [Actinomycetes bacterium]